jgi:tRNA(Ile)-lysidine synthase
MFLYLVDKKMLKRFGKFVAENKLVNPADRILLAVSGGIDSMVMTHLFMQSEYDIGIAHCNFLLRSAESDKDEELVSKFAAEHKIEFFSTRFDTKAYATENGISVQMAARELRYRWFENIRKENGYDSIAVAHNLNDNIETMMINLIRGTGIEGLTGMKPATNNIIRPLLFATRQEIVKHCKKHMISYREDLSNADTKYLRNKIRHNILPVFKEINPSVESTLNETAERLSGINEIFNDYINRLREDVTVQNNECIIFNISSLIPYINNKAVLYELFRPYGIGNVPLTDLIHIIKGKTGSRLITGTHRIIKNRQELVLSGAKEEDKVRLLIDDPGGFDMIPEIESVRSVRIKKGFEIPEGRLSACIDSDKLSFPLVLRKWNAGDYFYPLGMNQKKKLSDYFIDNKYSIFDKDNALILESVGKIVCILGDRIDNRFRITGASKNALIIISRKKCQDGIAHQ